MATVNRQRARTAIVRRKTFLREAILDTRYAEL
jgi:hypothetical protein